MSFLGSIPSLSRPRGHALVLAHVDVVAAQIVQAVREAVLVDQRGRNHGIDDPAFDLHALGPEPARVVGGVVHHHRQILARQQLGQPAHGHLGVEVVPILVTDREVPLLVAGRDGDADDEAVVASPAGAERRQVRVTCLEVEGDLSGSREVWILGRDVPVLLDLPELQSL